MAPLLRARVVDSFMASRGSLVARIFGLIPVARSTGPATDKGEAMRGLAELPWRSYAFRERFGLIWEEVEPDTLRAIFGDGHRRATVEFEVGADGRVLGGWAPDRPRIFGKQVVETPWLGAFRDYPVFDGVRVPT